MGPEHSGPAVLSPGSQDDERQDRLDDAARPGGRVEPVGGHGRDPGGSCRGAERRQPHEQLPAGRFDGYIERFHGDRGSARQPSIHLRPAIRPNTHVRGRALLRLPFHDLRCGLRCRGRYGLWLQLGGLGRIAHREQQLRLPLRKRLRGLPPRERHLHRIRCTHRDLRSLQSGHWKVRNLQPVERSLRQGRPNRNLEAAGV